jgi:hypothetical protein
MSDYQPKIRKFSGDEIPIQWLQDYISEIDGAGGLTNSKHVYFCRCLKGAAKDWYCNVLEYKPKVYWDLLAAAFSSHWNPITCDIRTVEVSPNLTPPDNICQPLTARSAYIPPPSDYATNTTLNWATNIDESIGPVPSASDFRPTTPSQLVCAPSEPTVTPPNDDVATETIPVEPTPAAPILLDNRITTAHVDAFVNTPAIYAILAHPPRDLSGLKSGMRNPWGSLNHRNRRAHPPQMRNPHLGSESLKNFHSRTWRSEPVQPFVGKSQHSQLHSHPLSAPVIQTIQHPRGISPIKPEITKTVSIASRPPPETPKPISAAQCVCGRSIIPVYPHQSWRFVGAGRSFGRRRVGTWGEERAQGHSQFRRTQAWGPRFRERGYMDQLHWSQNRRPRIGTRRSHVDRLLCS